MTYPTNPSFDTRILGAYNRILGRINDAVVNKLIEVQDRLDWSIRTDLDDEADELHSVISDCNKVKDQAEGRLDEILDYLTDGGFTPRPQVPEGAGLVPAAGLTPGLEGSYDQVKVRVDEDDAPEGYRAVAFVACEECAFAGRPCPKGVDGLLLCSSEARDGGYEVHFLKRD